MHPRITLPTKQHYLDLSYANEISRLESELGTTKHVESLLKIDWVFVNKTFEKCIVYTVKSKMLILTFFTCPRKSTLNFKLK